MVGRLLAPAALALALAAAFAPVLFGDRTLSSAAWVSGALPGGPVGAERPLLPPPVRDLEGATWVDEPAPYLVHRELERGSSPTWNAAEGLGIPLLGNPNMAALSPLAWVVDLAPSARVQDLTWIARLLLLGWFTIGLARELGAGWLGAFSAGTALALGGQSVQWIQHHPLNTDVFVPAALWAALSTGRRGRRAQACLSLAVAAGLLGLKPQSAIMGGLFGLVVLLAAERDRVGNDASWLAPASRSLARATAGTVVGLGLAAVALLPFAEAYDQASGLVRAARTTQSGFTLPVAALPSLVGWEMGEGEGRFAGLPHAGLWTLLGALLGCVATRASWVSRALAVTVVLEILRIHGLLPLPLAHVPVLGSIQFVKYCFPLYLALALLLARGVDALPQRAGLLLALVVALELIWLVPDDRARRVDPYATPPWVESLVDLQLQRPGRMSGEVDLAPPLVSAALGLRDLRSIDVLTPRDTYDFVSRLVAPSRGITWILADPDPLLAATGPGANLADLRWIASRAPLRAGDLPAANRAAIISRRMTRLFDDLVSMGLETARRGGGLHDGGGDLRFHWTCETPCRFSFVLKRVPPTFAVGLSAPRATDLRVRLAAAGEGAGWQSVQADPSWQDLRLAGDDLVGRPGELVLEIDADWPTTVWVGGVGPAPSVAEEARREEQELGYRQTAFETLSLRWSDDTAHLYENPGAGGEAAFAERIVRVADRDAAFSCVAEHPGEIVACVFGPDARDASLSRARPGPGEVQIEHSGSSDLRVRTRSPEDRLLIVSRLLAPGWQARIDGRPLGLLRISGALMGVVVPAGEHVVEVFYAPLPLRIGAWVSVLSLLVVLWLWWSGRATGPQSGRI